MKAMDKKLVVLFSLMMLLTSLMNNVFGQAGPLTAPVGTAQIPSDYVDPTIPDDPVFIFCSPDQNGDTISGQLSVMGGYANCTYIWGLYDPDPTSATFQQFVPFLVGPVPTGPSSTVTDLVSGFYQVIITCNVGLPSETSMCRRAHVFVNKTILNFDPIAPGCNPFDLTGGVIDAVSDFTIYDPPATPFEVDASTTIKVCFWADHTFVSDLGFYLYGPQGNRIDLLPPVSAWNQGAQITSLVIGNVLDCSPSDYYTNCNSGNNIQNFCFSSALPAGDPTYTPCICDMPTPLTGTFASCEGWSDIYGNMASDGGWAVSIFDCFPADVGSLQRVTLSFQGNGQCGPTTYIYDSGPINEVINDGACDSTTAAIYYIPLKTTKNHTITNEVTAVWSSYPTAWNTAAWGSTDFGFNPIPSIDPEPSQSTYFCLTVHDHLYDTLGIEITNYVPCEPQVCQYFNTLPTDPTIVNPPVELCASGPPVQLIPLNYSGAWSAGCGPFDPGTNSGCITGGGFFFPSNAFLGPNQITYAFGGVCASDTTITINVVDAPVVSNIEETCNSTNTQYQVCFHIQGGNAGAYSITNSATGLPFGGSYSGSTWCSSWITSGTGYNMVVTDNNDCDPQTIVGFHDCGCSSSAGDMPNPMIQVCAFDPATAVVAPGTYTLDGNDGFEYFLHTDPYGNLGTVIAHNTTGTFLFQPPMVYGQTYYISQVVGNNIGTPTAHLVNINDPCRSVSSGTPVKWFEFPTANAGANNYICGKTIQLNANAPTVGVGTWSSLNITGVVWSPSFNDPHTNVTVPVFDTNQYGCKLNTSYSFRWKVTNGPCQIFDDVTMTFKPKPIAFAGNDTTVCGLEVDMNAHYSLCGPQGISTGIWSGDGIIGSPLNPNTTINVFNSGSYTYGWKEWNDECTSEDYVTVTYYAQPEVDANHNDSVCGSSYLLNAISTMGTGIWTGPLGTVFGNATSPTSTAEIIYGPGQSEVPAVFTWTEQNVNCSASDNVTIVYSTYPNAAAGLDDWTCGTSYTFDADVFGYEYAIGTWSTDFTGAGFVNAHDPGATVTIPNTGSFAGQPQAGSFGDSSYVVIPFTWVMDNNRCTDEDIVNITFYQMPVAFAGPDSSVCGKIYQMKAKKSIGKSKGKWTMVSGPSPAPPTWSDNTNQNSTVQVPLHGEYVFQWKEDNFHNQGCTSSDLVTIYFIEIPNVNAGPDKYVCGENTNLEAINSTGTGIWLPTQAQITDPLDPHSMTHYGLSGTNDTVQYVWQEYNTYGGIQCVSYDSVSVVFMIEPNATVLWDPQTSLNYVCGKTEDDEQILVAQASGITGTNVVSYWVGNDASFFPNTFAKDPDSVRVFSYGMHYFNWVIENHHQFAVCADTSITIEVDFIEQPIANSGPMYDTACISLQFDSLYHLSGNWSTTTGDSLVGTWITGTPNHVSFWYQTPTGFIQSDSLPNCWVMVDFIDPVTPVSYPLAWQETNYGVSGNYCSDWDTTIVKFAPKPTGEIELLYGPHCLGFRGDEFEAKIRAKQDYSIINYNWSNIGGGEMSDAAGNIITTAGTEEFYVTWPNPQPLQQHEIRLITTNTWQCVAPAIPDIVPEPNHVAVEIEAVPASCGEPTGEINLDPLNSALINNYGWIDTLGVSWAGSVADHQTDLATGDYWFWARAKSIVIPNDAGYQCKDSFFVHVGDTGYIASLFKLQNPLDSLGISPHSIEFSNLSYMVDSNYVDPVGLFISDLVNELPPSGEVNADYEWRFYHIAFDSVPDFNSPVVIYPWEVPVVFNGNEIIEDINPIMEFIDPGYYKIMLVAISDVGCRDTFITGYPYVDAKSEIKPGVNVFTPNGDGQNDLLEFDTQTLKTMHGMIYSRWGKLVYEWTWNEDDQEPMPGWWDGKLSNGQDASPGVYFYVLEGIGQDGTEFGGDQYAKAFHLIREKK